MKFAIALRMALLGMAASSQIPVSGSERAKRAVNNVNVNVHVNGQSLDNTGLPELPSREFPSQEIPRAGSTSGCTDKGLYCRKWATDGQCTKNPIYMRFECARSCNHCENGGGDRGEVL